MTRLTLPEAVSIGLYIAIIGGSALLGYWFLGRWFA